jgi:hypothetical protein
MTAIIPVLLTALLAALRLSGAHAWNLPKRQLQQQQQQQEDEPTTQLDQPGARLLHSMHCFPKQDAVFTSETNWQPASRFVVRSSGHILSCVAYPLCATAISRARALLCHRRPWAPPIHPSHMHLNVNCSMNIQQTFAILGPLWRALDLQIRVHRHPGAPAPAARNARRRTRRDEPEKTCRLEVARFSTSASKARLQTRC